MAVVICENYCFNLAKIIDDTPVEYVIRTSIGEMLGLIKGNITDFVVKRVKKMVPDYQLTGVHNVTFKEALDIGEDYPVSLYEGDPEDTIVLQYTGGTTGVAKGAELTNRNLIANVLQTNQVVQNPGLNDWDHKVALCCLPMYHIFAFTVNVVSVMSSGFRNILVTNPRDL